jgi:hypothetical protein
MNTENQTNVINPNLAAGLTRLVNVVYWSGWSVVGLFLLLAIAWTIGEVVQPGADAFSMTVAFWLFCAFSAIVWWGFCRICRYVWKGSEGSSNARRQAAR